MLKLLCLRLYLFFIIIKLCRDFAGACFNSPLCILLECSTFFPLSSYYCNNFLLGSLVCVDTRWKYICTTTVIANIYFARLNFSRSPSRLPWTCSRGRSQQHKCFRTPQVTNSVKAEIEARWQNIKNINCTFLIYCPRLQQWMMSRSSFSASWLGLLENSLR